MRNSNAVNVPIFQHEFLSVAIAYPSIDESLFKRQDRLPLQSLELRRIDPEVLRLGREEVRLLGGDDDDVEQVLPVFAQHVLHALMSKP